MKGARLCSPIDPFADSRVRSVEPLINLRPSSITPTFDGLTKLIYNDASDTPTNFTDLAGSVEVASDLDLIRRIDNKGTLGGNMTVKDDANRIQWEYPHAGLNGNAAWNLYVGAVGRGVRGDLGSSHDLSAGAWHILVMKVPQGNQSFGGFASMDNKAGTGYEHQVLVMHNTVEIDAYGAYLNIARPNDWCVLIYRTNPTSGNAEAWINGVDASTASPNASTDQFLTAVRHSIGCRFTAAADTPSYMAIPGWLALRVVGDLSMMTDADVPTVSTELMTRFGIS